MKVQHVEVVTGIEIAIEKNCLGLAGFYARFFFWHEAAREFYSTPWAGWQATTVLTLINYHWYPFVPLGGARQSVLSILVQRN